MVTINASTTAGLVMTSDLSGTLSLQSNGVAVTVPAVAGTMMVSGNMPAFSAYLPTSTQSVNTASWTKVAFSATEFDTNTNFNTSTYRFTPTVAGYYQFNSSILLNSINAGAITNIAIYKNGSEIRRGSGGSISQSTNDLYINVSSIIQANGSTDYFEIYVYQATGSTKTLYFGQSYTYFNGSLVRSA